MRQYYCKQCKLVQTVQADGHCTKCGSSIIDEPLATEHDLEIAPEIKPIKRPPQIRVNGPRMKPEDFAKGDPDTPKGPLKRHERPRPQDCDHPIILEKQIAFSQGERNSAVMRGMSLPNFASLDFCVNCWDVNPENFASEAHSLLKNLLETFAKRNDGLTAPDPERAKAAWASAHEYMERCNQLIANNQKEHEGMT